MEFKLPNALEKSEPRYPAQSHKDTSIVSCFDAEGYKFIRCQVVNVHVRESQPNAQVRHDLDLLKGPIKLKMKMKMKVKLKADMQIKLCMTSQ